MDWQPFVVEHFIGAMRAETLGNDFALFFVVAFPLVTGPLLLLLRGAPWPSPARGAWPVVSLLMGLAWGLLAMSALLAPGRQVLGGWLGTYYARTQLTLEQSAREADQADLARRAEQAGQDEFNQLPESPNPFVPMPAQDLADLEAGALAGCRVRVWEPTGSWEQPLLAWWIAPGTAPPFVWVSGRGRNRDGLAMIASDPFRASVENNDALERQVLPPRGEDHRPGLFTLLAENRLYSTLLHNRNPRFPRRDAAGLVGWRLLWKPAYTPQDLQELAAPEQLAIVARGATPEQVGWVAGGITNIMVRSDEAVLIRAAAGTWVATSTEPADLVRLLTMTGLVPGKKASVHAEIKRREDGALSVLVWNEALVRQQLAIREGHKPLYPVLRPLGPVLQADGRPRRELLSRFTDARRLLIASECRGELMPELVQRAAALE